MSIPALPGGKKPVSFDILAIGVISLMAVGSWVIFDVYRAATVTTVPRVLQRQIRPLKSQIEDQLITEIQNRRKFEQADLEVVLPKAYIPLEERSSTPIVSPLEITPTPTPELTSPEATVAAEVPEEITPTPESTQSEEINL